MGPKAATEVVLWSVKLPEAVSVVVEASGLEEEEGVSFRIAAPNLYSYPSHVLRW